MRFLRTLVIVLGAGALGGAFVGIDESVLVTLTSGGGDEYWMFLFGALAYGAVGAALGLGGALAGGLLRRRADERTLGSWAVGTAVAPLAFVVGRYHVVKRVFGEQLVSGSMTGIVTHLLLLLAALLMVVASVFVLRLCLRRFGSGGPVLAFAAASAVCLLIGSVTGKSEAMPNLRRVAPKAAAGRPNLILIVADTLRADAVEWQGDGGFAQLARDGVVFDRAQVQASWTRPSIASILTGLYPSEHGAVQKMDFLPDRVLTLAEALREEGYWTAGVTTNINVAPVFNFQQGFDEYVYLEPSFYFGATDSCTQLAVYKGLRVARERLFASRIYYEHYYQDAVVVNGWLDGWLKQRPPEPFFLFIHYMDPHDPYFEMPYNGHGVARVTNPTPPADRAEELHDLYLQGVRYLDGYVGNLVEALKAQGIYDRSVLAFTADHGEEFYEHDGWWHGTSLYEEVIHVPLLLKRAAEPLAGQRRDDIVRSIDVAPTLVAAAGLPVPREFRGIDLFSGQVEGPVLAEEDLEGNRLTSLRSAGWKLIVANEGNPRGLAPTELFDLIADPLEKRNLASSEPQRASDMLAQLAELRRQTAR